MTTAQKELILLDNPETKQQEVYGSISKHYGPSHAEYLLRIKNDPSSVTFAENKAFTKRHNSIKRLLPTDNTQVNLVNLPQKTVEEHPMDREPERDTYEEHLPKKSAEKKKPTENLPESFIQLFTSMTNNTELLKIMRKCMTLYLYLAGNIKRFPDENDCFKLYENYYKKGLLAVAITGTELHKRLGIDRGIISGYVTHMEKNGIINIDKKQRKTDKGTKEHNIYILGTVEKTKNGKDIYNLFINKDCWKTQHTI